MTNKKHYFLGVDTGGSKSHALIADESGQAIGFGKGGPGNWESIGYPGLTKVLLNITKQAVEMAGIYINQITGAGFGIAGYDWPSQREAHIEAIKPLKLYAPFEIVNDVIIALLAGASEGWGIAVVAGTGSNCRGWDKEHHREGRLIATGEFSGESGGGGDMVWHALQAIAYEWTCRGPATQLTPAFIKAKGARDLADLIEGLTIHKYQESPADAILVFQVATKGDPIANKIIKDTGYELGDMARGVIRQLGFEKLEFEVVMGGSLFDGSPLLTESMQFAIHELAPSARLVRLKAPPVVGGVVLGMEQAGMDARPVRSQLLLSTQELLQRLSGQ